MVRPGFREIAQGWMLVSGMADLTERIERLAEWTKFNGPLEPVEEATVKAMIECQIARGIARGDFEPFIRGEGHGQD